MHEKSVLILRQLAKKINFRCKIAPFDGNWKPVAEYCDRSCMIFRGIQIYMYLC